MTNVRRVEFDNNVMLALHDNTFISIVEPLIKSKQVHYYDTFII